MSNLFFFFTTLLICSFNNVSNGQDSVPSCLAPNTKPFTECAAIFLDDKMLVDDNSPKGKCKVKEDASGTLSVSTVQMNLLCALPFFQNVEFKVAIRNGKTNTLWLYSEESFKSIDLKKVIEKCEMGDEIILLTVDKNYSLPHNTVEIAWSGGC